MKSVSIFRIILTIVALLLVITVFALSGGLEHTVYAPLIADEVIQNDGDTADTEPDEMPPPSEEDIAEEPETPEITEPEPESEPEYEPDDFVFIDPGYVLLRMNPADISRGHLILVNHDHEYVFPDVNDSELIAVFDYITDAVGLITERTMLSESIINPLNEMMDAFYEATGITNVIIRSGFRGASEQRQIFENNIRRWGREGALRWAKPPGHSEHHTGLGIDFGLRVGGAINMFSGTGAHSWIPRNSHNFGFILRYPNNRTAITGTNFEPWHYRYVGIPHAPLMRERNWVLEQYIDNIRNHTYENPLEFTFNDVVYTIFFTDELEVRLPYDVDFDFSGNNIDGFIVTFWQSPVGERSEYG